MAGSENFTIDNPVGQDKPIQRIQTFLFNKLSWDNLEVYGRASKLPTEKGFAPRWFVSGKDYKDIFTDDRYAGRIFFITDNQHETKQGLLFTVKVKVVFMLDLKKCYPSLTKRADSEAQQEAVSLISQCREFTFDGEIETDIEDVFKGFNVESIPRADLQPMHVFSLNGSINYTFDGSCNNNN